MTLSKKHPRSSDDELVLNNGKRIKLDSLLNNLTISDDSPRTHSFIENKNNSSNTPNYIINPKVKQYSVLKKGSSPSSSATSTNLNSFITEKLISHFNNIINSNLSVLLWYNYRFLIIYKFQKWALGLFNRFIRKYNKRNKTNIKTLKYYDNMINLIKENKISFQDLMNIILQENQIELIKIRQRQQRRDADHSDKENDTEVLKDISYNYWDTFKFDKELEMEDAEDKALEEPKIVQLDDTYLDSDMDIDMANDDSGNTNGRPVESNYGSYYHDYNNSIKNDLMSV